MALIDSTNLFSSAQAITADAASTNVIDLGVAGRDIGPGVEIPVLVQVIEAFDNLTSVKVSLQTSTTENFASPIELCSQTIALASLTAGAKFNGIRAVPPVTSRYLRLYYDITGTTPTTGTITAFILPPCGRQESKAYPDAL
jgi:hypothetical protein